MDHKLPLVRQEPLRDLLQNAPVPDSMARIVDDFHRTGSYEQKDLERLMGGPSRRVESGVDQATHSSSFLCR